MGTEGLNPLPSKTANGSGLRPRLFTEGLIPSLPGLAIRFRGA
jgi:hypothetical protein